MPYKNDSISSIVEKIDKKQFYLPAIQRKYVWGEEQITKLMDSIMRGYPFGTFLFWKVKKKTVNTKQYSMYEFIKDYHERDNYKNSPAGQPFTIHDDDEMISSVLDGQQRLTSLYIALKGSLSFKLPRKHWSSDDAFPKKELYFDLHSKGESSEGDIAYNFTFLTDDEFENLSNNEIWFKVKNILQYKDVSDLNQFLLSQNWVADTLLTKNIVRLQQQLQDNGIINYFEVESDTIDDVLDIFVRVNSGGTVLSKTDLLFSTIVSYWDKGREEIDSLLSSINKIGDHYKFSNDFIMRTCLYITDLPIALKVETFGKSNVELIKSKWNNIQSAIKDTIKLLNNLGFNADNIIADTAILPIIFYRYQYGSQAFAKDTVKKGVVFDVQLEIRKYLVVAQINHIFGQSTNSTLTAIRKELKTHRDKFKVSYLQGLTFGGDKNLKCNNVDISNWFDSFEKNAYTFMLLTLLYPNLKYGQNTFHQDHMHPYSSFEDDTVLRNLQLPQNSGVMDEDKIQTWKHQRNTLANLQMLEEIDNESKNDEPLIDWLKRPENTQNVKYLPQNIDYSLSNFDEFLEKRKVLMIDALEKILL